LVLSTQEALYFRRRDYHLTIKELRSILSRASLTRATIAESRAISASTAFIVGNPEILKDSFLYRRRSMFNWLRRLTLFLTIGFTTCHGGTKIAALFTTTEILLLVPLCMVGYGSYRGSGYRRSYGGYRGSYQRRGYVRRGYGRPSYYGSRTAAIPGRSAYVLR